LFAECTNGILRSCVTFKDVESCGVGFERFDSAEIS
jgi:hypothetical protein